MLGILLPRRCALCGRTGSGMCSDCAASLPPAPEVRSPPGLDDLWALLAYQGTTARLVAELKFRNHRDVVDAVGRAMAVLLTAAPTPISTLTWAPTSAGRRRERGYDQAELIARSVADAAGIRAASALRRRPGPPQTGATRIARLSGPSFDPVRPVTGHVVVIDDVSTTGATLAAAGRALRAGGAERVSGLVLAVRP